MSYPRVAGEQRHPDVFSTPPVAAVQTFTFVDFTLIAALLSQQEWSFTVDDVSTDGRGKPWHPPLPCLVSSVRTRLSRAKPLSPLFISSSMTALLFVCHPPVNRNDLSAEVHSQINKIGLSHLSCEHLSHHHCGDGRRNTTKVSVNGCWQDDKAVKGFWSLKFNIKNNI